MRLVATIGAAALVALGFVAPARATPSEPSPAERKAAKALADEGLTLFGKGDYTGAVDRLGRAESIVPLPTIRLQRARALERLGRWVEAKHALVTVAATDLPRTAPPVHKKAVADAKRELDDLEARIPRLVVSVSPAMRPDDAISIDGRVVADPQDPFFELDPGEHVVSVSRAGGAHAESTITLSPGERRTVELSLAPPTPKAPPPAPETGLSTLEVVGWIGVGVGGAALVVSAATGIPAISMAADLSDRCPNDRCPSTAFDDLSEYDALRWTAGVTLIAGLALAGAGSTAIVLSRTSDGDPLAPKIEARIGPAHATVWVTF